ncbi:MAG: ABC transporter permease [Bacteroidales bacterium]
MIKYCFKLAFRNFKGNILFSILNIVGISSSLCVALFIFIYVGQELGIDSHEGKADNIFRVELKKPSIPYFTLKDIKAKIPEVEDVCVLDPYYHAKSYLCTETFHFSARCLGVDKNFFDFIPFRLLKGNPKEVFSNFNSIVLTESCAKKLLGSKDDLGQIIYLKKLSSEKKVAYILSGIVEDFTNQTSLNADVLFLNNISRYDRRAFFPSFTSLARLSPGANIKKVSQKLVTELNRHLIMGANSNNYINSFDVNFLPYSDIYFKGKGDVFRSGDKQTVNTLLGIALIILIIGGLNYIVLSVSMISKRYRSIGVYKTLGATPRLLFKQNIVETFIIMIFSLLLVYMLIFLLLPIVNSWLPSYDAIIINRQNIWILFLAVPIAFFYALIVGCYPSIVLAKIQPVKALQGKLSFGKTTLNLKRYMISAQFGLSIILLFSTFIFFNQVKFIEKRPLGYHSEDVVYFYNSSSFRKKFDVIINEIKKSPFVNEIAFANYIPGKFYGKTTLRINNSMTWLRLNLVDEEFVKTFGLEIVKGRDFVRGDYLNSTGSAIINEKLLKLFPDENPIGKKIGNYKVVGVVKDFCDRKPNRPIDPVVLVAKKKKNELSRCVIRFKKGKLLEGYKDVEEVCNRYISEFPITLKILRKSGSEMFLKDRLEYRLLFVFSIIAIILSCLGLFSFSVFLSEKRKKEICIRKIHGASIPQIFRLVLLYHGKMILIANIFGLTLGYFFMGFWLNQHPVHIEISWVPILYTFLVSTIVCSFTILYESCKLIFTNPLSGIS